MKKLMILGGMLGFGIGATFGRLQEASDATILWRACVSALVSGLLLRWWGRLWLNNLRESLTEQMRRQRQQMAASQPATPNSR